MSLVRIGDPWMMSKIGPSRLHFSSSRVNRPFSLPMVGGSFYIIKKTLNTSFLKHHFPILSSEMTVLHIFILWERERERERVIIIPEIRFKNKYSLTWKFIRIRKRQHCNTSLTPVNERESLFSALRSPISGGISIKQML